MIVERQGNVLCGVLEAKQVERLEYEADVTVAQFSRCRLRDHADLPAVERVIALILTVEDADDIEQRGFAGPRRTHDRHQFPGLHAEIDALENMQGLVSHRVGLVDVFKAQHRVLLSEFFALTI